MDDVHCTVSMYVPREGREWREGEFIPEIQKFIGIGNAHHHNKFLGVLRLRDVISGFLLIAPCAYEWRNYRYYYTLLLVDPV